MSYSTLTGDNLYIYSEYHANNNGGGKSEFSAMTDNWLFPQGDYMEGNYPSVEIMVMPFEQNYPSNGYQIDFGASCVYVNGNCEEISPQVLAYYCNENGVQGRDLIQITFIGYNWENVWIGFNFSYIAQQSFGYLEEFCSQTLPSNMWLPNLY
jgi:hypothetical protein